MMLECRIEPVERYAKLESQTLKISPNLKLQNLASRISCLRRSNYQDERKRKLK